MKKIYYIGKIAMWSVIALILLPIVTTILLGVFLIVCDEIAAFQEKITTKSPVICPVDERYVGTRWIANEANAYLDVPAEHEGYDYVVVYQKGKKTICIEICMYDNRYVYVDGPENVDEFQWGIQLDEEMAYGYFEWIDPDHFRLYLGGGAAEEAIGPVLTFTRTKIPEEEPDEGDEGLIEEGERQLAA